MLYTVVIIAILLLILYTTTSGLILSLHASKFRSLYMSEPRAGFNWWEAWGGGD